MISESLYFIQCDFVYGKKDAYGDYVNYIFIYFYDGEKTAMSFFTFNVMLVVGIVICLDFIVVYNLLYSLYNYIRQLGIYFLRNNI